MFFGLRRGYTTLTNFAETYTRAADRHRQPDRENPLAILVRTGELWRVQKYVSMTRAHVGRLLAAGPMAGCWRSFIPDDVKAIMASHF